VYFAGKTRSRIALEPASFHEKTVGTKRLLPWRLALIFGFLEQFWRCSL
jgi:hypothetical protein